MLTGRQQVINKHVQKMCVDVRIIIIDKILPQLIELENSSKESDQLFYLGKLQHDIVAVNKTMCNMVKKTSFLHDQ